MLGPFEGSAQSHQSRHREHVDEPIERLVVRFAQAHCKRVTHLAGAALAPGAGPIGVVVVLLRSWHVVCHLLSKSVRSFMNVTNVHGPTNDSRIWENFSRT